jgi:hypothetical protein
LDEGSGESTRVSRRQGCFFSSFFVSLPFLPFKKKGGRTKKEKKGGGEGWRGRGGGEWGWERGKVVTSEKEEKEGPPKKGVGQQGKHGARFLGVRGKGHNISVFSLQKKERKWKGQQSNIRNEKKKKKERGEGRGKAGCYPF